MSNIGLVAEDPWLAPYEQEIANRCQRFDSKLQRIEEKYGSLPEFAKGHAYYGIHYDALRKGWVYREWAPEAYSLSLIGDFNDWDAKRNPLTKNESGDWEVFLPEKDYAGTFVHGSRVKVQVHATNGIYDRIPAYITRCVQDPATYDFSGQVWLPEKNFTWSDSQFSPSVATPLMIYEAHIGMAQEKEGIGSYQEFSDLVLPRIKAQGYNAIQMMAVQEHPYYGSYGYHVSNFFSPSSRFGTPDELKYLINKAHNLGIVVIMDIVHSHAVKNFAEGLNDFDGSGGQYFHEGSRGYHELWDSKLFNYGKEEVLRFLLSNVRYWMEEFHFDGFRFDGVTSMLYTHHGNYMNFDHYDKYFNDVDWDAVTYLQLANTLIHRIKTDALSIAEDMSGMPGLCRPVKNGGLGFDFRLGMGIPDYWIKLLKEKADEDWDIYEMWHTLTNRRYKEHTIAYAESHDQALVGDKTLAFWLMDQEMYWHMAKEDANLVVERGMALHKMIRLFTSSLGGEAYLNFIGNEFGHPEWIDFPREGNNWSYKHARRQWSLVDNPALKYQWLNDWDRDMVALLKKYNIPLSLPAQQVNMDPHNKVIIFERNNLLFLFNFSVANSIFDYRFRVLEEGMYRIILNSDSAKYGGQGRVDDTIDYYTFKNFGPDFLSVYLTNRTALVMERVG